MKAEIIYVEDRLDALSDFDIKPCVVDEYARIDEIRLALSFTAAKTRQNAIGLHETDSCLREPYALTIPERELTTDKVGIIEDGIKAGCFCICRVLVPLGEEEGAAKSQVVVVYRRLDRTHMRLDPRAASGNRIPVVP